MGLIQKKTAYCLNGNRGKGDMNLITGSNMKHENQHTDDNGKATSKELMRVKYGSGILGRNSL